MFQGLYTSVCRPPQVVYCNSFWLRVCSLNEYKGDRFASRVSSNMAIYSRIMFAVGACLTQRLYVAVLSFLSTSISWNVNVDDASEFPWNMEPISYSIQFPDADLCSNKCCRFVTIADCCFQKTFHFSFCAGPAHAHTQGPWGPPDDLGV